MSVKEYSYAIHGAANGGKSWSASGTVQCEWHHVLDRIMIHVLDSIDKSDCPFDIHELTIHQMPR